MIKTILVTIEEFLENGGKLTPERKIFSSKDFEYSFCGYFLKFDKKTNSVILHNRLMKSFPVSPSVFYIAISARPIYA